MKKQINLLICIIAFVQAYSQTTNKTTEPCTDSIVQNTKGEWVNTEGFSKVTTAQKQEINSRLNVLHNILLNMFPSQPVGVDVKVNRSSQTGFFGATRKYSYNLDNVLFYDYAKTLPIISISYFANFCHHKCIGAAFHRGKSWANKDGIFMHINDFSYLTTGPPPDDDWTINGLPVMMLNPVMPEKWKGYTVYGDSRARERVILLHREGILPYIPVTRKQYLDRCIEYKTRLHNKLIEVFKQQPVRSAEEQEKEKKAKLDKFQKQFANDEKKLKANVDYYLSQYKTDQQVKDERIAKAIEIRDRDLKVFTDELEKTTHEGLLDSPAIIRVWYYTVPSVFETDPQQGSMLITENPDYIRKDLPVYVPQFMILWWYWSSDWYPPYKVFEKTFYQDFPIKKLQAMIDK